MTRILPSQRGTILYVERSRIYVEGERVVQATAESAHTRLWNVPHINTSVILVGQGCSITQEAMRLLAEEKVLVAIVGTGATPIFMGSLSEYAPTEHLQDWIRLWLDPARRLAAAKQLAHDRIAFIAKMWPQPWANLPRHKALNVFAERVDGARTVEALRGHEGDFAKATYDHVAGALKVSWIGRTFYDRPAQDQANRFLDQGNYLAYGLAGVVLWALGIPPGLAVNHGVTRAGGLVFDLADVIKDACVLPRAFRAVAAGQRAVEFRNDLVEDLDRAGALPHLFDVTMKVLRSSKEGDA